MSKVKVRFVMMSWRGQVWIEATSLENALRKAGQHENADEIADAVDKAREGDR